MQQPVYNLDAVDQQILQIMQKKGRITNAQLAEKVGISPPAMLERVKRLEKAGVITGYCARVDPKAVGIDITAWISVTLSMHQLQSIDLFQNAIHDLPEVLECYHITGEADFLLKVVAASISEYENFILHKLAKIPGMSKMQTTLVLSEVKNVSSIPIETTK